MPYGKSSKGSAMKMSGSKMSNKKMHAQKTQRAMGVDHGSAGPGKGMKGSGSASAVEKHSSGWM